MKRYSVRFLMCDKFHTTDIKAVSYDAALRSFLSKFPAAPDWFIVEK